MSAISIRIKILVALFVGIAAALGVVVLVMQQGYNADVEASAEDALAGASRAFDNLEQRDVSMLSATVDALATRDDVKAAYASGDRKKLEALAAPLFKGLKDRYGITHMYFIDGNGKVVLRAHKPAQSGDLLKRVTFLQSQQTGSYGSGLELGATAFALRVVRPWYSSASGGKPAGYLELGEEIDHFLGIIKGQTKSEFGLLLEKDKLDQKAWADYRKQAGLKDNWDEHKGYVLASTTKPEWAEEMDYDKPASQIADGGDIIGTFSEEGGVTEVRGVFPVRDANGKKVGAVFTVYDISEMAAAIRDSQNKVIFTLVVFAIALGIVLSVLLNALVFNRLNRMMDHMKESSLRLAGGEFDIAPVDSGANDEIGKFERFYGDFVRLIGGTLKQLGGPRG